MKKWQARRVLDYAAQRRYFIEHPDCEICGRPAVQVHEIIPRGRGGKCRWDNMISLCYEHHQAAHFLRKPYLRDRDLREAKV